MSELDPAGARGAPFLDPEEGLSRAALDDLQRVRLLEMVPYAYERSALTRQMWDRCGVRPEQVDSVESFSRLAPFVTKSDLHRFRMQTGDPFAGTLCVPIGQLGCLGSTSGTTGRPTMVAQTMGGPTETARGRELWMLGVRPGDRVAVFMFSFRSGLELLLGRAPAMGVERVFVRHSPDSVAELFEVTRRFAPRLLYLISTPAIIAIDEYARANGIDVRTEFACYRAAVYGGEPLGPWASDRLAEWNLTAVQMTAAGDSLPATECLVRTGSHVWEDQVLVELLEPGGDEPSTTDRGELVVTSLTDKASPLLRFRTNDVVRLDRTTCQCGRTHSRIKTLGRTDDLLSVGGRTLLPSDITPLLAGVEECRMGLFQVVRPKAGSAGPLVLRVGCDDGVATGRHAGLRGMLADMVAEHLDASLEVVVVPNSDLLRQGPPHKIPRTVSA